MVTDIRIGLVICECGTLIKQALDVPALIDALEPEPNLVWIQSVPLVCSEAGQTSLADDIRSHNLTHVVVAGCSPKEHEQTFQTVMTRAGLNPFLLQPVNIREQCIWVSPNQKTGLEKPLRLIRAALRRVVTHLPIKARYVACRMETVIVGAGVAGLSAAILLAHAGRIVYLVEKKPCIGGRTATLESVFPEMSCASCMLDPLMDEVLHHPQIHVMLLSEMGRVLGYAGNFIVTVKTRPRFVDEAACLGCGACVDVCPVELPNEFEENLGRRKAISIPYPGSLPSLAVLDQDACRHWAEESCTACQSVCPFDAIHFEQTGQVRDIDCGAIVLCTGNDGDGSTVANGVLPADYDNVLTAFEFERLIHSSGPTQGRLVKKDDACPDTVGLFLDASPDSSTSRTDSFGWRQYLKRFSALIREKAPQCLIHAFILGVASALDHPGPADTMVNHPVDDSKAPEIRNQNAMLEIRYADRSDHIQTFGCDMLVIGPSWTGGRHLASLAETLRISQSPDGFFQKGHHHLAPVTTTRDGIYAAGCYMGPESISDSVLQAQAAAGQILSRFAPGQMHALSPWASFIHAENCAECGVCISICPYQAIDRESHPPVIQESLCQGCGACAAACPSGAIESPHFSIPNMTAEICGILETCAND